MKNMKTIIVSAFLIWIAFTAHYIKERRSIEERIRSSEAYYDKIRSINAGRVYYPNHIDKKRMMAIANLQNHRH
jgi:hypothetical protein